MQALLEDLRPIKSAPKRKRGAQPVDKLSASDTGLPSGIPRKTQISYSQKYGAKACKDVGSLLRRPPAPRHFQRPPSAEVTDRIQNFKAKMSGRGSVAPSLSFKSVDATPKQQLLSFAPQPNGNGLQRSEFVGWPFVGYQGQPHAETMPQLSGPQILSQSRSGSDSFHGFHSRAPTLWSVAEPQFQSQWPVTPYAVQQTPAWGFQPITTNDDDLSIEE